MTTKKTSNRTLSGSSSSSTTKRPYPNVINTTKLQDLVHEINPNFVLHPTVEELLLDIADEFIDSVAQFSCRLAKHRRSTLLESKDVQFCLEKHWGIHVPGFQEHSTNSMGEMTTRNVTKVKPRIEKGSVHHSRMQLKRKMLQKMEERKMKKLARMSTGGSISTPYTNTSNPTISTNGTTNSIRQTNLPVIKASSGSKSSKKEKKKG